MEPSTLRTGGQKDEYYNRRLSINKNEKENEQSNNEKAKEKGCGKDDLDDDESRYNWFVAWQGYPKINPLRFGFDDDFGVAGQRSHTAVDAKWDWLTLMD